VAFTRKKIDVEFSLANGQFEGGGNTVTISGLRVSASILNLSANSGQAEIAVYGLPLSMMNQLSTVGMDYARQYQNHVELRAGSDEEGMTVVWSGDIYIAFADMLDMPMVCLRISSRPGAFHAMKPVAPVSIRGSADVSGMMKQLAGQMGFDFEDAGVQVKLANPYYAGTAWDQAMQIARDAGISLVMDKKTMVIVPPGKSRKGDVPVIAPWTGMKGYPQFNQNQIVVTSLFNPAVKPFGTVEVHSDLTSANGQWVVNKLEYALESMMPHGRWDMIITGIPKGRPTIA